MRRLLLVVTVMALLATIVVASTMPAIADQKSRNGTCEVGGSGSGAEGCAGNVGGFIETGNGDCNQINSGPFVSKRYSNKC